MNQTEYSTKTIIYSGFDEIMNLDAGTFPPSINNQQQQQPHQQTQNNLETTPTNSANPTSQQLHQQNLSEEEQERNRVRALNPQQQDKLVEDKIQEILEKKKAVERNINVCMYGRHDLTGDKDLKFTVTHCYHNGNEDLFDVEELKKEFTGETFENMKTMYMNLKVPLKIEQRFKTLQLHGQPGRSLE